MSDLPRREALREIVEAAGAFVRLAFDDPHDVVRKADGSPVTEVDREVDAILKRDLAALLPGAGWLSEETADDPVRLSRNLVWIVDPIDGTKEMIARRPELAVSVGLVRDGRPVAAAVSNPVTGETGTWVEGAPPVYEGLAPRAAPATLTAAEAVLSRTETAERDFDGLLDLVGSVRHVGSIAYKLLRVAAGADAITFSVLGKSEWDVCGGVALLEASGRSYLRLDGAPNLFNRADPRIRSGAVAGPAELAEPLRRALVERLGGVVRR